MARVKRSVTAPAIPASEAKVQMSLPAATDSTAADATPTAKATAAAAIVIEIPSSPDYSSEGSATGSSWNKARKRSAPPLYLDDEIEMWTPREKRRLEEDCQILAGDPIADAELAATTAAAGNDDIEIVAERGKVACRDYPHPRSACARHPFNTTPHERHCGKCFCFVCDIAAPCVFWVGSGGHCHASEKELRWKDMRWLKRKIDTKKA